jgi:predicted phage replisome organizer
MGDLMSKKYYWLKLNDEFFDGKVIKKLRRLAGGDTYVIIYLKMQLLSIKTDGKLFFEGIENSFEEELALDIDEDVENVKVTVAYLEKMELIESTIEDEYILPGVLELIGSESQSAERVRRYRENKQNNLLQCNASVTECNVNVQKSNIEIEIEKEIEIEIDKEIYKENSIPSSIPEAVPAKKEKIDFYCIKESYNLICIDLPRIEAITEARCKKVKALLVELDKSRLLMDLSIYQRMEHIFKLANESDFLSGRNADNSWCGFDWLINKSNALKVIEGNYKNGSKKLQGKSTNKFNNFPQREYSAEYYKNLEKNLLNKTI